MFTRTSHLPDSREQNRRHVESWQDLKLVFRAVLLATASLSPPSRRTLRSYHLRLVEMTTLLIRPYYSLFILVPSCVQS